MADEEKSNNSEQVAVGVAEEDNEGVGKSTEPEESPAGGTGAEDPEAGHGEQSACEKAESAYGCDRETVWMLAQMLMPSDRDRVAAWLTKLDECKDLEVRSQYAKFLLSVTASGSLRSEPFQKLPAVGPLRRLGEVVDPVVLFGLTLSPSACAAKGIAVKKTTGPPEARPTAEAFYARNPIPEDGTICYAAAFSDFCMR